MNPARQELREFMAELSAEGYSDFDGLRESDQDKATSLVIVDWACDKRLRNSVWEFITEGDQSVPVYLAGVLAGNDPDRLLNALKKGARDYARRLIDEALEAAINERRAA